MVKDERRGRWDDGIRGREGQMEEQKNLIDLWLIHSPQCVSVYHHLAAHGHRVMLCERQTDTMVSRLTYYLHLR